MTKKGYNPLKMWGSYAIGIIGAILGYISLAGCGWQAGICSASSTITFPLTGFIIGFIIGYVIHSIFRFWRNLYR